MKKKRKVSIPSRGSGKGDVGSNVTVGNTVAGGFQSPLGEVVKETIILWFVLMTYTMKFQSPLGEVVKETRIFFTEWPHLCFNPLSGKW